MEDNWPGPQTTWEGFDAMVKEVMDHISRWEPRIKYAIITGILDEDQPSWRTAPIDPAIVRLLNLYVE